MSDKEIQSIVMRAEAELDMLKDKARETDILAKENLELRIKIDKAIEYLTEEGVCILNKGMKENERLVWSWGNYYDLLDILKGEDNDN